MIFLYAWLLIGLGVYMGAAASRLDTMLYGYREDFKEWVLSIARGLVLGIFFWPVALVIVGADVAVQAHIKEVKGKKSK